MAKRAVARRGRSLVALILLGFVLVATGVIWRRTEGMTQATEIDMLDRQRRELEARRAKLRSEIRDASSFERLGPIAEQRLRMRVPSDSQVIYIDRAPAPKRDDSR